MAISLREFFFIRMVLAIVHDFSHLFGQGLLNSGALFPSSFNFALWAFDPADGCGKIDGDEEKLLVVDEGDEVADIFFEADLVVIGLLVEGSLVFADEGLLLVVLAVVGAALEGEFEVAAEGEG